MIIKDEMTGFWCYTLQHNIKEKIRFKPGMFFFKYLIMIKNTYSSLFEIILESKPSLK